MEENNTGGGGGKKKLTPQQFAQKIKEKYPSYRDMEDSVLVEKMVEKYPSYKEQINFDTQTPAQSKGVKRVEGNGQNGELASTSAQNNSSSESKKLTTEDYSAKEFVQDLDRYQAYQVMKMNGEDVPPYEQYRQENPTRQEQLNNTALPEERERLKKQFQERDDEIKSETYKRFANYSERHKADKLYEKMKSDTELTPQEAEELESEYKRIKSGDLTVWESIKAYAAGALEARLSPNPAQPIEPSIDNPSITERRREATEKKKIEFMKKLSDDDRANLQEYIKYSPEGSENKSVKLKQENEDIVNETKFLQDKMLEINDKPLIKQYNIAAKRSKRDGIDFINSLSKTQKEELVRDYTTLVDTFELHEDNMELFNQNAEDLQSYEIEKDLANKNFSLGANMAMAYTDSWFNIMGGATSAMLDPLIESTKPEGMSYKEYREKITEGSILEYMEETQEQIQEESVGRKLNDNPFSLERLALLSAEQLPVLATVSTGGGGLGVIGASTYGGKVNEYAEDDGEVSWDERFAGGLAATGEVLSERITQGLLSKGGRMFKAAKKEGTLSDIFTPQFVAGNLANAAEEGGSEAAAKLVENFSDIYIAGRKDKSLFDGIEEAALDGAIMGGMMKTVPEIAGSTLGTFYGDSAKIKKIKNTSKEIQDLMGEVAKNPDMSEESFNIIEERVDNLTKANKKRVNDLVGNVEKMSASEIGDLTRIGERLIEDKRKLKAINDDQNLSPEVKQKISKSYENNIEALEMKRNEIINKERGDKSFEDLTPTEKLKYAEKASKELQKGKTPDKNFKITSEQINKEAKKIYLDEQNQRAIELEAAEGKRRGNKQEGADTSTTGNDGKPNAKKGSTNEIVYEDSKTVEPETKIGKFFDNLKRQTGQKFADTFTNINRELAGLKKARDFYKKQGLFESKAAYRVNTAFDSFVDNIKTVSKSKFKIQELSDYMYAKHAVNRNKYIKENVDENNPFGSGMSQEKIDEVMSKYTDEQKQELEKLAKPFYDMIENSRKMLIESGLMSEEAVQNLKKADGSYVPLTGFAEELEDIVGALEGKALNVKGKEFKSMKGRKSEANNVLANILEQYTKISIRASKNELLSSLDDIKKSNDVNEVPFEIYTSENLPKSKALNANGQVVYRKKPAQIDNSFIGFKKNGKQMYIEFDNPIIAKNLMKATDAEIDSFTRHFGKLNRYLSATFTQYNPTFMIPNFFRDLQTGLINLKAQADINPALKGKDLSAKAAKRVLPSIRVIYNNERSGKVDDSELGRYYEEFKEEGAKTGWANRMTLRQLNDKVKSIEGMFNESGNLTAKAKAKEGWKSFTDLVNDSNTAIENGIRLSTYAEARKAGLSKLDAASLAKELTINFNRKGDYSNLMNTLYLFFNAAVQGNNTFRKNMLKAKKYKGADGKVRKTLNRAQKTAIAASVASTALTLFNMGVSGEDEESGLDYYSSLPDYIKERNLIIVNPVTGTDHVSIPLPYGYNVISNMGTMAAEVTFGDRTVKDAGGFVLGSLLGSFMPLSLPEGDLTRKAFYAALPTIATPFVNLAENEDNWERQIYRENFVFSDSKLSSANLGSKNTKEIYKKAAILMNELTGGNKFEEGTLGFHPDKAEFLTEFFGGGTLKFLSDTYGTAEKSYYNLTGSDIKVDANRVPLLNKVYGEDTMFPEMNIYYEVKENYKPRLNYLEENKSVTPRERNALKKLDALYDITDEKLKKIRKEEEEVLKLDDSREKLEGLEEIDIKKKKAYSEHVKKYLRIKRRLEENYE